MTDAISAALALAKPAPHTGPLNSPVAGRTDHLAIDVPAESFVIPADVVSSLGQGNTANGMAILSHRFGDSAPQARKDGGAVPIMAAGGEFVVSPEAVAREGGGDIKRGHGVLMEFVKHARAEHIKTLKKLPGPHK